MNHKELLETLRVYAVVTKKPNLIKLLSDKLTIKQYLENVLELGIDRLPEYETGVKLEEKKLQVCKDCELKHRIFMLKDAKNRLQSQRQHIKNIKRELHKFSNESKK